MKQNITELSLLKYVSRHDASKRVVNRVGQLYYRNTKRHVSLGEFLCLGLDDFRSRKDIAHDHVRGIKECLQKDGLPFQSEMLIDPLEIKMLPEDEKSEIFIEKLKQRHPNIDWDSKTLEPIEIEDLKIYQYVIEKIDFFPNRQSYDNIRRRSGDITIRDIREVGEENAAELSGLSEAALPILKDALRSDGLFLPISGPAPINPDTVTINCSQNFFEALQIQGANNEISPEKLSTLFSYISDRIKRAKGVVKNDKNYSSDRYEILHGFSGSSQWLTSALKAETILIECSKETYQALMTEAYSAKIDRHKLASMVAFMSDKLLHESNIIGVQKNSFGNYEIKLEI